MTGKNHNLLRLRSIFTTAAVSACLTAVLCACAGSHVEDAPAAGGKPKVENETGPVSSDDPAAEDRVKVEKEDDRTDPTRIFELSKTMDIEEMLKAYSIGFSLENEPDFDRILYNGDIGDLIGQYKDIDLNGDKVPDPIIRTAKEKDGEISVSYRIAITDGPAIETPTVVDALGMYRSGGDVFEFNDIDDDGIDEVLHTRYYLSTAGFHVAECNIYHVTGNEWKGRALTEEVYDAVGAELTGDGAAVLVDYSDKWSHCYDVFLYKKDGDDFKCTGNGTGYVKEFWPVKYSNSFSLASDLTDEERGALSDFVNTVAMTGKLPDGTDVSDFVEATGKKLEGGFSAGVFWFTIVDLGQDDQFGIRVWASMREEGDGLLGGSETDRLYGFDMKDKKAFFISDQSVFRYYKGGYFVMSSADGNEYSACRYDPAGRTLEVLATSDDMWSDEIEGALKDCEIVSSPEFSLNGNFSLYRQLGTGLEIVNNGQASPDESDMHNEFY